MEIWITPNSNTLNQIVYYTEKIENNIKILQKVIVKYSNVKVNATISDDFLKSVSEDSQGNLWIGTLSGGLNMLNPKTGEFISYIHNNKDPQSLSDNEVNSVFEDARHRLIHLQVFSPIDLAVSKISRFASQDREDILLLASRGFFTTEQLRTHAVAALDYYVGNTHWVRGTIDLICEDIAHENESRPVR